MKPNRGVKGRRVMWKGEEWTVAHVDASGRLHLRRERKNRTWQIGALARNEVKFVKRDYTAK